ncbi:hypothetical protein P691DRAFT_766228 [Macrolepiota fuliginosa MF-IS2]|uniref:Uncharacterized protein n=1 Tax=Macrolepiota fuliginosa MF-IS2 TaxID=1400762 RepID=A0A9P5WYQ1_9AGAR|nr:hypothetical protein P691DRAFT_766228 [Macrolepiota fuliginosa MF-IS2]
MGDNMLKGCSSRQTVIELQMQFQYKMREVLKETLMSGEPSLTSEIEDFKRHVEGITPALKWLLTAKDLLCTKEFIPTISMFSRCLSRQLNTIQEVFELWEFHIRTYKTEALSFIPNTSTMMCNVFQQGSTAQSLYASIKFMLTTQFNEGKGKQVEKKRKKEDGDRASRAKECHRLAMEDEVMKVLTQLQSAIEAIGHFTNELSMALLHHSNGLRGSAAI